MHTTRRLTRTLVPSLTLIGALLSLPVHAQSSCNASIPETTPTSAFTFNAAGTVTDTRTGLEWKRCLEGQTFNDNSTPGVFTDDSCTGSGGIYTWQGALAAGAASTFDGGGWRLPNLNELASIAERRCFSPAANLEVFPNLGNDVLWSASPYAAGAGSAWSLDFGSGGDNALGRSFSLQVRLVRAGQ